LVERIRQMAYLASHTAVSIKLDPYAIVGG
jgi:hypothetical protein